MRKILFYIAVGIAFAGIISCSKTKTNIINDSNKDTAKVVVTDTIVEEEIDTIALNLAADFKLYQDYILAKDYAKVMEYYYPGMIASIQQAVPELSGEEISKKIEEKLPQIYEANFQKYISGTVVGAKSYNSFFNKIEKKITDGDKIAAVYSRITYIYTDKDSIRNETPELGIAVSLNKGKNWYFLDENDDDSRTSLKTDFSEADIDSIFSVK